jgi:hypothetical protein
MIKTFIFVNYNYNKCIEVIDRWLQAQVTEIDKGNIALHSIHLEKVYNEITTFTKWQLNIEYFEKTRTK